MRTNNRTMLAAQWLLIGTLWAVFCLDGLTSSVAIWWGNEIFNHGFFILPGSLYLLYLKRQRLRQFVLTPTLLPIIFIIPCILLYVAGSVADVRLFLHMATFTLLPLLVWSLVGHRLAWEMLFPLCFMLFCIPVGEQLIPVLQEITAEGAVSLLAASGIPLYKSGLYIEIPQGRFLVAEACSGVSFFIASLVIGSLYAYLNFHGMPKRLMFFGISIVVPIVANIVRVYGIISIAYLTDMEYAAGADHLIYGWFFFAFVLFCLLGIGELLRDKTFPSNEAPWSDQHAPKSTWASTRSHTGFISVLFVFAIVWQSWALSRLDAQQLDSFAFSPVASDASCPAVMWQARMHRPTYERYDSLAETDCTLVLYRAVFDEHDNELVSGLNRLYDAQSWSRINTGILRVNQQRFSWEAIVSPSEQQFILLDWYEVNGVRFSSGYQAKLYQVRQAMLGQPTAGTRFILATTEAPAAFEQRLNALESRGAFFLVGQIP